MSQDTLNPFIALDTETTGLDKDEDAIIEIGCVHWAGQGPTGKTFHQFINPGRSIDEGATRVHGITLSQLKDKPAFYEIADTFLAEIKDQIVVIHNADFDVGFINEALKRCQHAVRDIRQHATIIDSLALAKMKYPGQRNSLDALCKRLNIDNAARTLHGALLDAQLLAQVYATLRAEQTQLLAPKTAGNTQHPTATITDYNTTLTKRPRLLQATTEEEEAHQHFLTHIRTSSGHCCWDNNHDPIED
jgi:DNA polymerase III subunit epsilon